MSHELFLPSSSFHIRRTLLELLEPLACRLLFIMYYAQVLANSVCLLSAFASVALCWNLLNLWLVTFITMYYVLVSRIMFVVFQPSHSSDFVGPIRSRTQHFRCIDQNAGQHVWQLRERVDSCCLVPQVRKHMTILYCVR